MNDLRDQLDHPWAGEPVLRDPQQVLSASRRALRRHRLRGASLAGAAAVVVALAVGPLADEPWRDSAATDGPAAAPRSTTGTTPEVDPARDRYPRQARITDCLVDQGWDAWLSGNGGISFEGTTAEVHDYRADLRACSRRIAGHAGASRP